MKNQPLYFGLPINIQDILTARTVEWERLKIHSIPGPDRSIRDEDMKNRRLVSRREREHFRKHVLRPALQAGLVSMVNPEKPNAANQRYRLTTMGRELLSQSNK